MRPSKKGVHKAERFIAAAIDAGLTTAAHAPRLIGDGRGNVRTTPELKRLLKKWDEEGHFWKHTLEDLKLFKARGFAAAEIDNLDRPLDDVQTKAFDRASVGLTGRLGFHRTYADEYVSGTILTLILKNINVQALTQIQPRLANLGADDHPAKLPRASSRTSIFSKWTTWIGQRARQSRMPPHKSVSRPCLAREPTATMRSELLARMQWQVSPPSPPRPDPDLWIVVASSRNDLSLP